MFIVRMHCSDRNDPENESFGTRILGVYRWEWFARWIAWWNMPRYSPYNIALEVERVSGY